VSEAGAEAETEFSPESVTDGLAATEQTAGHIVGCTGSGIQTEGSKADACPSGILLAVSGFRKAAAPHLPTLQLETLLVGVRHTKVPWVPRPIPHKLLCFQAAAASGEDAVGEPKATEPPSPSRASPAPEPSVTSSAAASAGDTPGVTAKPLSTAENATKQGGQAPQKPFNMLNKRHGLWHGRVFFSNSPFALSLKTCLALQAAERQAPQQQVQQVAQLAVHRCQFQSVSRHSGLHHHPASSGRPMRVSRSWTMLCILTP
jgi:hypothetical protein